MATLVARLTLDVGWGQRPLLILFMLPIIVSAYWGGFGPGILATVLAALSVDYLLIPPARSLAIQEGRDLVQLLIFVADGVVISVLNEALHRSRREAERRQRGEEAVQRRLSEQERDLAATLDTLRESEARFRHLAESGIIGIIVVDTLGNILEANDAFLRMVGYSREDLTSGAVRWAEMTPPEWAELDKIAIRDLITTGVAQAWEKEYYRKDGSRIPVLVGVAMLEAPRALAFVLDLSQQKRTEEFGAQAVALAERESTHREQAEAALRKTEEHLRQAQKMEAIGRLAGGIAHDFNNLLSVVLSYSELLLRDLGPADPMRADIEQISRAGQRASELTHQLLAFSRRQVLQPKVLDPNEVIAGMTAMLRRVVGEDIEVVFLPTPNIGQVFVDPGQMEQVLLNLVVNARDAMPRGGTLTIEATSIEIDSAGAAEQLDIAPGRYVMLAVTDTGMGMDRATQARIFEPFFTTKPKGKGTGLGLSTAFGIVKQSGGQIHVESEPGKGTGFRIYLPRTDASPKAADEGRATPHKLRGDETILLVDDDEQVRHVAVAILRRQGYNVLEAATPGDALLICEQFEGRIHLLVTDVVMPRMSGRQLWERLAPLEPDMKVLFMSGYADDAIVSYGVLSSELAFVQKPLVPAQLLTKVRSVLDAEGTRR
jgi:PAS domain S-box-containing protein